MNNLTSQLYTEYFNIIKLEFELLNELIKRQSELHADISRVINNHQNILSQQNNTISTIQIIIITPKEHLFILFL